MEIHASGPSASGSISPDVWTDLAVFGQPIQMSRHFHPNQAGALCEQICPVTFVQNLKCMTKSLQAHCPALSLIDQPIHFSTSQFTGQTV